MEERSDSKYHSWLVGKLRQLAKTCQTIYSSGMLTDEDIRITALKKLEKISLIYLISVTKLDYFYDESLSNEEFLERFRREIYDCDLSSMQSILQNYHKRIRFHFIIDIFSVAEETIRVTLKKDLESDEEFKKTNYDIAFKDDLFRFYPSLPIVKSRYRLTEEEVKLLLILSLIRNVVHNNGIHLGGTKPPIDYKGVIYSFENGKNFEQVSTECALSLANDLVDFFKKLKDNTHQLGEVKDPQSEK